MTNARIVISGKLLISATSVFVVKPSFAKGIAQMPANGTAGSAKEIAAAEYFLVTGKPIRNGYGLGVKQSNIDLLINYGPSAQSAYVSHRQSEQLK